MNKCLAARDDLQSNTFRSLMQEINRVARAGSLEEHTTYSRIWEYPWVWLQLEPLKGRGLQVLDVGSEKSPFPWFLATQGFRVVISDRTARWWQLWRTAKRQLKVAVSKRILDCQDLDIPTASLDIYLSVSVVEHVPDKARVIAEAARVLRPGGLLVMTFDICEPDMGMTFPAWNGRALTTGEFDELFRNAAFFEGGLSEIRWNTEVIPEYLAWHRTTAPHHNYVTGAAVVRRNDRPWVEAPWRDRLRNLRGRAVLGSSVTKWFLEHGPRAFVRRLPPRMLKRIFQRLMTPSLESLPNAPDLFLVYRDLCRHRDVERRPGGWFYEGRFYPDYITVGGASHAIFREALRFCRGRGIDIGAGLWPLPGATAVDIWRGPGTAHSLADIANGSLDYVFSSHCLEHIENWRAALKEWITKLKPGGLLFLYLPHPECAIWRPGSPFVGDGHRWVPTPELLRQGLAELGCAIEACDDGPDAMFSFWVCGRKEL